MWQQFWKASSCQFFVLLQLIVPIVLEDLDLKLRIQHLEDRSEVFCKDLFLPCRSQYTLQQVVRELVSPCCPITCSLRQFRCCCSLICSSATSSQLLKYLNQLNLPIHYNMSLMFSNQKSYA
jgi:hypothetical protein